MSADIDRLESFIDFIHVVTNFATASERANERTNDQVATFFQLRTSISGNHARLNTAHGKRPTCPDFQNFFEQTLYYCSLNCYTYIILVYGTIINLALQILSNIRLDIHSVSHRNCFMFVSCMDGLAWLFLAWIGLAWPVKSRPSVHLHVLTYVRTYLPTMQCKQTHHNKSKNKTRQARDISLSKTVTA